MKKTKKLILAEWLESHKLARSADGVMCLSNSENLGVQVKTLDSNGNFVIKFSASDPWIKPDEWLHNYKSAAKARYEEAAFVYRSLFPQEDSATLTTGGSDFDVRAYDSLKSSLNITEGEYFFKPKYPANKERFRNDVVSTLKRFPGLRRVESVLALTVGSSALSCMQVDGEAGQIVISEVNKISQK